MSSRILELAGLLQEAAEAKLYIADPYGNGYDSKPVKKGDVLTRENGNFVDFDSIHSDGKHVNVMWGGKKIKVTLADIGGKLLLSGQTADKAFLGTEKTPAKATGGGKRQGAINMVLAASPVSSNLTKETFAKALGLAYDAGVADANKASSKQER